MICRSCGSEIAGPTHPKQVRHPDCQVRYRNRDRALRAQLGRIRRAPDTESPAVIEQKYQAALAEVKRTRPFTIEIGYTSPLARLG